MGVRPALLEALPVTPLTALQARLMPVTARLAQSLES